MLTERELDHFLDSFLAIPGEEPASREISSEAEERTWRNISCQQTD